MLGHGFALPPLVQSNTSPTNTEHTYRPLKVVNTFSEFEEPGGWVPVLQKYNIDTLQPPTTPVNTNYYLF